MILAALSEAAMEQIDNALSVAANKSPTVYIVLVFCSVVLVAFLWFLKQKDTQFIEHIKGHSEAEDKRLATMSDMQAACHEVANEHVKIVTETVTSNTEVIRELRPVLARVEGRLRNGGGL